MKKHLVAALAVICLALPGWAGAQGLNVDLDGGTPAGPASPSAPATPPGPAPTPGGGRVASNPAWGFSFTVPPGWIVKAGPKGAILGHNTIKGVIMVLPHSESNLAALQNQMARGVAESDLNLRLSGRLVRLTANSLAGDFAGFAGNRQVRARVVGVVNTGGFGGAYVLALVTPQAYSAEIAAAADYTGRGVRFPAGGGQAKLRRHFAGTWTTFRKYGQSWIAFGADGRFYYKSESSHGGTFRDSGGNQTGSWGAYGRNREAGVYMVRGNLRQGVIILRFKKGGTHQIRYRVHVERGKVYWREYRFNGALYSKKGS